MSLGSSAYLAKQAVRLQRAKSLQESLMKQQAELSETLRNHAAIEDSARRRVEELEAAVNDLLKTATNATMDEREQRKNLNALEPFQKQLANAKNEYERTSKPWRQALEQEGNLQQQADAAAQKIKQIADFGSDCLDIERDLGAFLKPSEWKVLKADGG